MCFYPHPQKFSPKIPHKAAVLVHLLWYFWPFPLFFNGSRSVMNWSYGVGFSAVLLNILVDFSASVNFGSFCRLCSRFCVVRDTLFPVLEGFKICNKFEAQYPSFLAVLVSIVVDFWGLGFTLLINSWYFL